MTPPSTEFSIGTSAAAASPAAHRVQRGRHRHHRDQLPGGRLRQRAQGGLGEGALGAEIGVAGRHALTLMALVDPARRSRPYHAGGADQGRPTSPACRPAASPLQQRAAPRTRPSPRRPAPRTARSTRAGGTRDSASPAVELALHRDEAAQRVGLPADEEQPGVRAPRPSRMPSWYENGRRSIAAPPFWSGRGDPGVGVDRDRPDRRRRPSCPGRIAVVSVPPVSGAPSTSGAR